MKELAWHRSDYAGRINSTVAPCFVVTKARVCVRIGRRPGQLHYFGEVQPHAPLSSDCMNVTIQAALAAHQAGRLQEAEAMYWELLRQNPYDASAMHLAGVVALQNQQFERAVELISKAIGISPNVPEFHHNIGAAYRVLGEFETAEKHYRRSLELKPDYAEAYFNLAAVRKFKPDDPILPPLQEQLDKQDWSDLDTCFLHFAAGKLFDDIGEYDTAYQHYEIGNSARNAKFDREGHRRLVDQIIAQTPRERIEQLAQEGFDDPAPVFIVGMPRTGSTLVEQILSSHSQVFGAGELPDISRIAYTIPQYVGGTNYPSYMSTIESRITRGFGEAYMKRLRSLHATAPRVVDKLPLNFLYLGLIAAMLPKARIIHTQRDPLDTCLSCYFQKFRSGQEYSYNVNDLAAYYHEYQRLMSHWREVLPLPMLEIEYEKLVDDQESHTRKLIDFLGLDWEDACLQFHKSERPVTTASNWQVRRPLDRSRKQRWRRYENQIGPLRDALRKSAKE